MSDSPHYAHSDLGNARLLNDTFYTQLKYRSDTSQWLHWNKSGHSWKILDPGDEINFAFQAALKRYEFCAVLEKLEDQKREAAFALQSQNIGRVQAMLTLGKTLEPIKSKDISWNAHPLLLADKHGVINLTDGTIRPGKRTDYITQQIEIGYNPDAKCPRWEQFIDEITCGNKELGGYLQRAVGYSLTGSVREQVFFLLHGTGRNGKSKFRNIVSRLLGSYSQAIRFAAFEENLSDAKRDLAELVGIRAAFASEGTETKGLDTAAIKYITGGEPIRTSRKYGHPFTFEPEFKLWLASNYLPKIKDDSPGFWRRIVVIPFDARFEGAADDKNLEDKLLAELPGILNWAVEGARIWFKNGLQTPESILYRLIQYRNSQDLISKFLDERCYLESDAKSQSNELYTHYCTFATENSEEALTISSFGKKIGERFEKKRSNQGWFYKGIGIKIDV